MHSCTCTEIAYKQHFLRSQNHFASQLSANHVQFRIAKLRFCIANSCIAHCDGIPDTGKFVPGVVSHLAAHNICSGSTQSGTGRTDAVEAEFGLCVFFFTREHILNSYCI